LAGPTGADRMLLVEAIAECGNLGKTGHAVSPNPSRLSTVERSLALYCWISDRSAKRWPSLTECDGHRHCRLLAA